MLMANGDKKLQSGDACPNCGKARLRVRTSKPVDKYQEQRLECVACEFTSVALVPADTIRRRRWLW